LAHRQLVGVSNDGRNFVTRRLAITSTFPFACPADEPAATLGARSARRDILD
jgi:hypothetical protein